MKRRNFIKAGAVGTATIAVLSTPAIATGRRELTMTSLVPKMFPGLGEHTMNFVNTVKAATDGRITIKLYGAGELVGAFESFDAASDGTVDIANTAANYYQGKSKALSFLATVPFGMTAMEQTAYLLSPQGKKRAVELCDKFNVVPLLCTNTGMQAAGWFRKEMKGLEDFKGLRMRITGLGGEIFKRLGASPVSIPGGEIFQALQSGTIDATEWVGPWNDVLMGFYKVAPYYYNPGVHEPGPALHYFFNKDTWVSLGTSDQTLLEAISNAEYLKGMTEYYEKNGGFLKKLQQSKKVKFLQYNDSIHQAMATAAKQIYTELADSGDDITKATLHEYFAFQKSIGAWTNIADSYYVDMRTRLFDI